MKFLARVSIFLIFFLTFSIDTQRISNDEEIKHRLQQVTHQEEELDHEINNLKVELHHIQKVIKE